MRINRDTIRDFSGKIIGYVDTESDGNKVARLFNGKIVGKYDKRLNVTREFNGKIIAKGDAVVSLIYKEQ